MVSEKTLLKTDSCDVINIAWQNIPQYCKYTIVYADLLPTITPPPHLKANKMIQTLILHDTTEVNIDWPNEAQTGR